MPSDSMAFCSEETLVLRRFLVLLRLVDIWVANLSEEVSRFFSLSVVAAFCALTSVTSASLRASVCSFSPTVTVVWMVRLTSSISERDAPAVLEEVSPVVSPRFSVPPAVELVLSMELFSFPLNSQ